MIIFCSSSRDFFPLQAFGFKASLWPLFLLCVNSQLQHFYGPFECRSEERRTIYDGTIFHTIHASTGSTLEPITKMRIHIIKYKSSIHLAFCNMETTETTSPPGMR